MSKPKPKSKSKVAPKPKVASKPKAKPARVPRERVVRGAAKGKPGGPKPEKPRDRRVRPAPQLPPVEAAPEVRPVRVASRAEIGLRLDRLLARPAAVVPSAPPAPREPVDTPQARLRSLLERALGLLATTRTETAARRDVRNGVGIMAAASAVENLVIVPDVDPPRGARLYDTIADLLRQVTELARGKLPDRRDWAFQNGAALALEGTSRMHREFVLGQAAAADGAPAAPLRAQAQ